MLRIALAAVLLAQSLAPAWPGPPPPVLPAPAAARLAASLQHASGHARHVWRDTPPVNADGTVNAYIEIPRGERRKFEFDIARHTRVIDRVMPDALGGYPINYGFVPQTISYDGDPFDALVAGPPVEGGQLVRGVVIGLFHMEDETGIDSKVVLSRVDANGRPTDALTAPDQPRIADYFSRYRAHEPGKFSRVPGWDSAERGRAYVDMTHRFFLECRGRPAGACALQ